MPRGRKSRIDMSTEAGRFLLRDMMHFKTTGWNPFMRKIIESEKFWKSRDLYQKVPFGAFKIQAVKMAQIAKSQMPLKEQKLQEKLAKENF